MHLAAIFGELFRDQIAGALLGEAELGMGVDVAADFGQLVEVVEDLGDDRHEGLRCRRTGSGAIVMRAPKSRRTIAIPRCKSHAAERAAESGH